MYFEKLFIMFIVYKKYPCVIKRVLRKLDIYLKKKDKKHIETKKINKEPERF